MMNRLLLFGAAVFLFTACSGGGDEVKPIPPTPPTPEPPTEEPGKIPIHITTGISTKATDTEFEPNDRVGIYVVNYAGGVPGRLSGTGNHVNNMRFTYTSAWTPDTEIYWKDETTKADFYCYYPFGTPGDIGAYAFATRTDQSAAADYKASDFLWGKASGMVPSANAVSIITTHSMSNALIYLEAGKGYTEASFATASKKVKICNVRVNATIDLATGIATAVGNPGEVTARSEGACYRALIVPQTVGGGLNLITVTVDGTVYTLAKGFSFVANRQHKFTLTINKTSGGGIDIGVGGWDTDGTDHGGSAE